MEGLILLDLEQALAERQNKKGLARNRAVGGAPIWEGPWGPQRRWFWYFGYYANTFRFGITVGDEFDITFGPFAAGVWFCGGGG